MRRLFIVAFFLHFFVLARSQNLDSLTRAIDSSSKAFEEVGKNFQRLQDSLYKLEIKRTIDQNGRNLDRFLADMKEREKSEKRQLYIRIGFGVVFLAVLIIVLARRRKKAQINNKP